MMEHAYLDSYKSFISFVLDTYAMDGAQSVTIWRGWDYDWDRIRAAGFTVTESGEDQYLIAWNDKAMLTREAASVGYLFVENEEAAE